MFRFLTLPILCLAVLNFGCSNAKNEPAEQSVKGQVMLDGKPMAEGEVTFAVIGVPGRPMVVTNGAFSGKAVAGKNRVEVRSFKAGPPLSTDAEKKPTQVNFLPDKYSAQSKLEADVKAGDANDFKFEVTSK